MVDVNIEVAADAGLREDLLAWVSRIPQVTEIELRPDGESLTASLNSPPQLATLVMAVAMYLRSQPAERRPAVTVTAPNGESLAVTTHPDPGEIRRGYIAMDRQPPPVPAAPAAIGAGEAVDAEIIDHVEEPETGTGRDG